MDPERTTTEAEVGLDQSPRNGKLTYQDIGLLVQLRQHKHLSQTELADIFGVTQSTISRLLLQFEDTRVVAKQRLHSEAAAIVDATVQATKVAALRGDANPGLELLDRLDIAVKKRQEAPGGAKVMIMVGGGGALPDLPTVTELG
jgi:DNA-binding XRE family transcriptional regulator